MTIGTTYTSGYKRNEVIAAALRKVTNSPQGDYTPLQVDQAVKALNGIIRTESARGDSPVHHFWALQDGVIFLSVGVARYELEDNTKNITSMVYRNVSGNDYPVHLISNVKWNEVANKGQTGDVERAYFKQNIDLAEQELFVTPVPNVATVASVVLGTDGLNYTCILKHKSLANTRPITGAGYELYWKQAGSGGVAWVVDTQYVNGPSLFYVYERPLFDFNLATDNPDIPAGWETYLIYKLSYVLSDDYHMPLDERKFLEYRVGQELKLLHPDARVKPTDVHNKGCFF